MFSITGGLFVVNESYTELLNIGKQHAFVYHRLSISYFCASLLETVHEKVCRDLDRVSVSTLRSEALT
jgi:hypothetical protein